LTVSAAADLPRIDSGAGMIEQLVDNLVSNAIKYTPEGGEVEVRFERDGASNVRIAVRDTGIGIPEQEQPMLAREFFRASNAREHTKDGTGLGLAIVKQTVDRHLGRMEIASAQGRGTTVEIVLPIHRDRSGTD